MSNGNQKGHTAAKAAVGAASGGETTMIGQDDVAILQKGSELMLSRVNDADIAAFMNDSESEFAPQIKSLEPGDMIVGLLEGYGNDTEFTQKDQATGKDVVRRVHTWILKSLHGNMRLSILSSAQLDSKLPPFIGGKVEIVRGQDLKSRSNAAFRIANYMVKGPAVAGLNRAAMWARKELPRPVIDVPSLPAGSVDPMTGAPDGGEDAQA